MFPVNFRKARAEYFLDCLSNGKPITYDGEQGGWTVNEMAGLAGACFFVIMSHGPLLRGAAAEMQGRTLESSNTAEHAEADDELISSDLHAAIEWIGNLTMLVWDGKYDEAFEELVICGATQEGDTEKRIAPIEGFKRAQ